MEEIRDLWGEPAGKDLFFIASMTDYYYLETLTSTAITHVYQDGIKLKVLGRNIRTFKPGIPFHIQVCFNCFTLSYRVLLVYVKVHFLTRKLSLITLTTSWLPETKNFDPWPQPSHFTKIVSRTNIQNIYAIDHLVQFSKVV